MQHLGMCRREAQFSTYAREVPINAIAGQPMSLTLSRFEHGLIDRLGIHGKDLFGIQYKAKKLYSQTFGLFETGYSNWGIGGPPT